MHAVNGTFYRTNCLRVKSTKCLCNTENYSVPCTVYITLYVYIDNCIENETNEIFNYFLCFILRKVECII